MICRGCWAGQSVHSGLSRTASEVSMSYRGRAGTGFVLATTMLLLLAAACGSKGPNVGSPTSASTAPSDEPTSTASGGPTPSAQRSQVSPSSGTGGQPHTSPRPNSSKPSPPVPNVSVDLSIDEGLQVYTPDCPFTYHIHAKITAFGP